MSSPTSLSTVKRLRWVMRQKSKLSKLLHVPMAVSIHCPFCQTRVEAGDYFCCSELEQMWALTARKSAVGPVLVSSHN
jgi:hypothetical protein